MEPDERSRVVCNKQQEPFCHACPTSNWNHAFFFKHLRLFVRSGSFFFIFSMCVFCCLYYYLTGICMHVWKLFPYGCPFLCPLFAFPLCIAACFPVCVCVHFPSPHPAARLHFSNGQAASFLAARLLFFFSLCWVSFNPSQCQQYHQLVLTCKKMSVRGCRESSRSTREVQQKKYQTKGLGCPEF